MSGPAHPASDSRSRRGVLSAAGILVFAVVAAYANSFGGAFIFDDIPTIVESPALHRLWPLTDVLGPGHAGGLTTSGRPIVALSLAVNYAIGGVSPWGYHVVNVSIHAVAALALFGIVRLTLERGFASPGVKPLPPFQSIPGIALAVAALWALHPLQTESVTYIVQRAESLAALFCLLTLYGFIRATEGGITPSAKQRDGDIALHPQSNAVRQNRRRWLGFSITACLLAMATKETVAATPLLVVLYDRTFVARSFATAWRMRRRYYGALAATWLVLVALVVGNAGRGGTAGFTQISPWQYALTQCEAIARYLLRAVWPRPLVFDYGVGTVQQLGSVLPQAIVLVTLLGLTVRALRRGSWLGFVGAWFFLLLAPSSSVVPVVTQTAAEHRIYLPLAAAVVLVVVGVMRFAGRWAFPVLTSCGIVFAVVTMVRNGDYQTEATIWRDTVAKNPANARGHNNLGQAQFRAGQYAAAEACYRRALRLQPNYAEPHYNLGVALSQRGDLAAAISHYETALRLRPAYPEAENNLGNALVRSGQPARALPHYEVALRIHPKFAEAHHNLGNALLGLQRPREAETHLREAIALKPDYAEAWYTLGNTLAESGRMDDALAAYRRALTVQPGYAAAHVNAGNALLALNRAPEALTEYEAALTADPALVEPRLNAGLALLDAGRFADAVTPLGEVVRRAPDRNDARRPLAFALRQLGRRDEAIAQYEAYLRAVPSDSEAREELRQLKAAEAR